MPESYVSRSSLAAHGDLKIEAQENLSRVPSLTSLAADQGFTGHEADKEYFDEPIWDANQCTSGSWDHATRGCGEEEEEEEEDAKNVQDNGPSGQFGVLAANWGGKWGSKHEGDYMNDDIENSVCVRL